MREFSFPGKFCYWQKKMSAAICFCVTYGENDFSFGNGTYFHEKTKREFIPNFHVSQQTDFFDKKTSRKYTNKICFNWLKRS